MTGQLQETNPIAFVMSHLGEDVPVLTYQDEYYSLMSLITDKLPLSGFGLCSGMGSCGTCLISFYGNGNRLQRTTLSCQVRVDDDLANVRIVVPDKVSF